MTSDLVIRNGTVVDGTGAPAFVADVAVTDGIITEVGDVAGRGHRELDADGRLVTPGFVDIHTHFDGQATWDPVLAPSSLHGVTTIAMGNCGVGFAPAHADKHDWLVGLLEGVEDIPGTALAEGLTWEWESFPEYLDALDAKPHTLDLGVHVPHAALRTYVMGDRGAEHLEAPTDDELARMTDLFRAALDAGALGFATSRTDVHRTKDGTNIGTLTASERELLAFADVMRAADTGVMQLISDAYQTPDDEFADREFDLMEAFARASGRPLSFTVQQAYHSPDRWRHLFARVAPLRAAGLDVKPQVASRPIGVLVGLPATAHPFLFTESFQRIAHLEGAARVAALREPERRARILAEHAQLVSGLPDGLFRQIVAGWDVYFALGDPVDYALDARSSVGARARAAGTDPAAVVYDTLLERDGTQLLYLPLFNFAHGDFGDLHEMITTEFALFGLSDAGAHCGAICDASMPTSAITLWSRDRTDEWHIPLEAIVHHQTRRTATHVGWHDRGVVAPGYAGDLNVIDVDALQCRIPHLVHDLPAGGRRLMQEAEGYDYTVKSGVVTFERGEHTGELPGRLLRGARSAPTT